ncbi:MAG: hypothetical protein AAF389_18515 [Gemmatimonadota bacterium]
MPRSVVTLWVGIVCMGSFSAEAVAQVDSTLARVRATNAIGEQGARTMLVSPGFSERAHEIDRLLDEADRFLSAELDFETDFALAVLDEEAWAEVWPFPYGVPYVSLAEPWVVVMPASPEAGVLMAPIEAILGTERARTAIDNIGFHEVGHIYGSALYPSLSPDGEPAVRWLDEFLASYLAYGFLEAAAPDRAAVWRSFIDGVLAGPRPRFTGLEDFDAEYYGYLGSADGALNYNWYQAAFLDLVVRIHADEGMGFMRSLHATVESFDGESIDSSAARGWLDALTPHFQEWLEGLESPSP